MYRAFLPPQEGGSLTAHMADDQHPRFVYDHGLLPSILLQGGGNLSHGLRGDLPGVPGVWLDSVKRPRLDHQGWLYFGAAGGVVGNGAGMSGVKVGLTG